jgi:hypothetical protein
MLWYILTALSPFVWIGVYQWLHYSEHQSKVARYERNKAMMDEAKATYGSKYHYFVDSHPGKFRWHWKYSTYHWPAGGAIATLLLTGLLSFIAGSLLSTWGPLHVEDAGTYSLISVGDTSKREGSYFLFSGYTDENQIFSYYTKESDGSYSRGWQYAAHSKIWQDQQPGKATLHQYYLMPNKVLGFEWLPHLRNEFHVPAGTIKENITLDNNN